MSADWLRRTVSELVQSGSILVEDGNHGEYRPLAHEFVPRGVPFIRPDDLKGGRIEFVGCDRINDEAVRRVRKGHGRAGDVLFTHRATVGRMALAQSNAPDFVANPGVTIWRSLHPRLLDQRFLYYWMHTDLFMDQVWAVAGSSDTFPYVSLTEQRKLWLPLPPISIQRAIASILGTLDDKIDLNRRMNETLEAMARAIFKDWFADFGPTRAKMEGREPYLAPDLWALFPGRLDTEGTPEGWPYAVLGELVSELRRGISPSYAESGGVRVLNQKCIRDRQVTFSPSRRHDPNMRAISGRELMRGDILVNSTGVGTLGRTAQIWDIDQTTVVDSHVTVVRPNEAYVSPYYLGLDLTGREDEIEALGEGSTGQTELARTRLAQFPVLRPPIVLQNAYENVVHPIIARMGSNQRESESLAAVRDLLLPKLMSSEIRVRDAEKVLETVA